LQMLAGGPFSRNSDEREKEEGNRYCEEEIWRRKRELGMKGPVAPKKSSITQWGEQSWDGLSRERKKKRVRRKKKKGPARRAGEEKNGCNEKTHWCEQKGNIQKKGRAEVEEKKDYQMGGCRAEKNRHGKETTASAGSQEVTLTGSPGCRKIPKKTSLPGK